MLSWKEFNNNNPDKLWWFNNRTSRLRKYQTYLKEETMKEQACNPPCTTTDSVYYQAVAKYISPAHTHSFGTVEAATESPKDWYNPFNQEKGNNPMNYATATVTAGTTETQDQRKYLAKRLDEVYYKLEAPLYAMFGLTDDDAPTSPKELSQRIKDGKFTIKGLKENEKSAESDDYDDDEYFHGYWTSMLRWRDPAKKADADGYKAATKELSDLRQKTLDIIKIDEPKAGLDAIKALEAWTPTGAAN